MTCHKAHTHEYIYIYTYVCTPGVYTRSVSIPGALPSRKPPPIPDDMMVSCRATRRSHKLYEPTSWVHIASNSDQHLTNELQHNRCKQTKQIKESGRVYVVTYHVERDILSYFIYLGHRPCNGES